MTVAVTKGSGYQNLASHVYSYHKDFQARMMASRGGSVVSITRAVSDKAANINGSLDWMISSNLPASLFDSEITKRY